MRIKVPSKRVRERFLLIYELEGCQKAVDFLTKHYQVKRMRIILDERRVEHHSVALYYQNRVYFKRKGLTKRTVLHELYHHLVYANGLDVAETGEEKAANNYSRVFMT